VLLVVLGLLAWQVTGFGARDMRSGYVPRAQVPRSETQEIPTYSTAVTAEMSAGIVLVTGDVDNGVSSGTGIILSESGLVLTNYHVVSGTTDLTVRIADTGHAYDADLLGRNVWADIAVLQLEGAGGLTEANIAADPVAVGDRVVAVGNGDGGGVLLASGGSVTELDATVMLESAFGSYGYEDADGMIRSTAGAIPGYSGGPTYNAATEVVGVTSAGQDAVAAQMSTYSIPIAKAAAIADDIAAGRQSEQTRIGPGAWLGVSLGTRNVAVLTAVYPNSPAAAAGLTPGSTITSFDGQPISSASGLLKVVESYDPDDVVDVAWQDDQGEPREASIVLGTSPTN
jgi:S1-C subfamily serine protease